MVDADTASGSNRKAVHAMVVVMAMSLEELRAGFRDGTLMFCLPAAHADLTNDFLEQFSERILKQSWSEVAEVAHLRIPALLKNPESEQALADAIALAYGADVSDLHGLSLWAVLRRCAEQPTRFRAGC